MDIRLLSAAIMGAFLIAFAGCQSAPEVTYDPRPRQWISSNETLLDGHPVRVWLTLVSDGTAVCIISSFGEFEYKKTKLYRYAIEGSRIIFDGNEAGEGAMICGTSIHLKLQEFTEPVVMKTFHEDVQPFLEYMRKN